MSIIKLKVTFLIDFIFTIFLCGLSFLTDFAEQLIGIFLLSFFYRFIYNCIFSEEENSNAK